MAEECDSINNDSNDGNQSPSVREPIKHLLIGSPKAVTRTIQILHLQGYSEVNNWSKAVPAGELGRVGEVVRILIKQVSPN